MSPDPARGQFPPSFARRWLVNPGRYAWISARRGLHRVTGPLRSLGGSGLWFRAATVTGGLALLLMLGWQVYVALGGLGSGEEGETQPGNTGWQQVADQKSAAIDEKQEPSVVSVVDPDGQPEVRPQQTGPDPAPTPIAGSGDPLPRSPFGDDPQTPMPQQPKAGELPSPFDDPPVTVKQPPPSTAGSPFEDGPAIKPPPAAGVKVDEPTIGFIPVDPGPVAARKPDAREPFLVSPAPAPETKTDDPGRVESPPLFAGEKKEEARLFPGEPERRPPAKSASGRNADQTAGLPPAELSLEVVRMGESSAGERFLVAAASDGTPATRSPAFARRTQTKKDSHDGTAVERGSKSRASAATESAGWSVARSEDARPTVLPVGRITTNTTDNVALSSTASTRWQVAAARLVVEMRSWPVDARRVRVEFRITNTGSAAAEDARLHVDLPPELRYHVGRKLLHRIGRLEAGRTHTARLTATIARPGRATVLADAVGGAEPASHAHTIALGGSRR